jgi:hypothetical protein
MTFFGSLFLLFNGAAMVVLPRRWAPLPLLLGACYMTTAQNIELGPFHFTVLRLLALIGAIRVVARGERLTGGLCGLDWMMLLWGAGLIASGVFHKSPGEALVFRLGTTYNAFGIYFLIRIFCQSTEDLIQLIKITAFLLVPVAIEMVHEKITGQNLFSVLGGIAEYVQVRDDKMRAQGPFAHAILAGTVGGVCLPFMIGIWREHALAAKIGAAACLTIVVTSTSSGPLMSVVFGVFALTLWRWRHLTRQMRIAAVVFYILLDIVMKDPAYFIIAKIDLTGSSTGWHRAQLLRQAFAHFDEWWLIGSDYTRHWMPYGVSWSPDHIDITNHYLQSGIYGGLLLMLIWIGVMWVAFRHVGQALRLQSDAPFTERFMIWSVGAGLFSHAVTGMSVYRRHGSNH